MVSIRKPSLCALRTAAATSLLAAAALAPAELRASPRDHVLRWIPPSGEVVGYRVHFGRATYLYEESVDLGAVPIDPDGVGRATLTLESTRDYYVALTAYNGAGESPPSNEIFLPASACDPLGCGDALECTADDCTAGGCTHAPLPDGTLCAASGGAPGQCVAGICEGVECTEASHCDDADPCNGAETCSAAGACASGALPACGAPSQCSVPSCDPARGCIQIALPDGTPCDDRKRSTLDDRCQAGVCEGVHKRDTGLRPK